MNGNERNGKEQKDMYDPASNTLDIRSNGIYPSHVLSNLCSNGFRFDGMVCGSMEGFLQSLKRREPEKQRQICSMKGGNARKMSVTSWQTDQIVWWKGQAIDRQSEAYLDLIRRAYRAMFEQNERFRTALMQTRGITLVHTSGENCPFRTILTASEFCGILTTLRDGYDLRDKTRELVEKSVPRKTLVYLHDFGASAACSEAVILRERLPDFTVVTPDLPADPAEALPFLRGLCMNEVPDIVAGSGTGALYALQLQGYRRVCLQPALGHVPAAGSYAYQGMRKNGDTHFEITPETVRRYAGLQEHLFDHLTGEDSRRVWALFADNGRQEGEEQMFRQHSLQTVRFSREHLACGTVVGEVLVPLVRNIIEKE